jgi:hypothetical protein
MMMSQNMFENWSEKKDVSQHHANPFRDTVEVGPDQRGGRLIRRFEQLSLEFRRKLERLALLLAHGAEHVIGQFADASADARADLFLQEVFNVFGESICHNKRIKYKG